MMNNTTILYNPNEQLQLISLDQCYQLVNYVDAEFLRYKIAVIVLTLLFLVLFIRVMYYKRLVEKE